MNINEQLLRKARAAGARLAGAELEVQRARAEYHGIVRRMHLAGGSLREIAQALGLSHQRVQQMVARAGGSWWQRIWSSRNLRRNMSCTSCRRTQRQVARLIAGPKVYICDACVGLAEQGMSGACTAGSWALAGENARVRCSFCGKKKTAGSPLLTGRKINICGQCLGICRQILKDSEAVPVT